jgi:shikimate kinase
MAHEHSAHTGNGVDGVDGGYERRDGDADDARRERLASNIVLIGASGAGKSATGWMLARLIGYGFIDLDQTIEAREKKPVHVIFEEKGEPYFRELERDLLRSLSGLRSHVLATGGGACVDDECWALIQALGTTVWINTPPEEIARRLNATEGELKKRPLLADVLAHKDGETRMKLLSERIKALIGNRVDRYKLANLQVADSFSTPESSAHLLKDTLIREGRVPLARGERPYDRWRIL